MKLSRTQHALVQYRMKRKWVKKEYEMKSSWEKYETVWTYGELISPNWYLHVIVLRVLCIYMWKYVRLQSVNSQLYFLFFSFRFARYVYNHWYVSQAVLKEKHLNTIAANQYSMLHHLIWPKIVPRLVNGEKKGVLSLLLVKCCGICTSEGAVRTTLYRYIKRKIHSIKW